MRSTELRSRKYNRSDDYRMVILPEGVAPKYPDTSAIYRIYILVELGNGGPGERIRTRNSLCPEGLPRERFFRVPNFKKKAIDLAKTLVKQKQNYVCERCGRSRDASGYQMHGSHVMSVSFAKTAALPENILCLCSSCHKMSPQSWHEDPVGAARWFDQKWPGRYDKLREMAVNYSRNPKPKIDWEEVYRELKERFDKQNN